MLAGVGWRRLRAARWASPVLLVLLAACGSGEGTLPADGTADNAIVSPTRQALEAFWSTTMPQVADVPYTPVTKWTPYRDSDLPELACGEAYADNAAYCPFDDSIEYSTDWLLELDQDYSRAGNMGSVVILAHEFGHHISDLHGRPFNLNIGQELQADCYAGSFLDGVDAGGYALTLQAGDVEDALQTLAGIANSEFDWADEKAHGGPEERRAAMARGWITGDPDYCAAYEKTGPILVRQFGRYSLRLPPASQVEELPSGSVQVVTATEPEFTTDLTAATGLTGTTAVDALTAYLPAYFKGTTHALVGDVESFGVLVNDLHVAHVRYEQTLASGRVIHGVVLLATNEVGSGLVIDTYADGALNDPSAAAWGPPGDFVFSTLWGATAG